MERYSRTQPGWGSSSMLPPRPRNSPTPADVFISENKRLSVTVDLRKSSIQESTNTSTTNTTTTTTTTNTNDHHSGGQEETVLLNTTMEMTMRDATEIIVVDTKKKSKKTEEHRPKIKDPGAAVVKVKAKREKKRNRKPGSASSDPGRPEGGDSTERGSVESQHVHTAALPLSEERTHKVVSRIPRFGKAKHCDGPNMVVQKKLLSCPGIALPEHNGCDILDPDRQVPTFREEARCSTNDTFIQDENAKNKLRMTNVASNSPRVIKREPPIPSMNLSYETRRTSNGKTTEDEDIDYGDAFSGHLDSQPLPVAFNEDTHFELGGRDCGFPEAGHPESKHQNPNRGLRKTFVVTRDGSPWESFSPDISTGAGILTPSSESQRVSEGQPSNDMGE